MREKPSFSSIWSCGRTHTRITFPLLIALTFGLILPFAIPLNAQDATEYHRRADDALHSFLLKFWDGKDQYLRAPFPDNGGLTGYWTYANGWEALLDAVQRTGQHTNLIECFFAGQDFRDWFSGYYDDECWMAVALLRAYDLTQEMKYLEKAKTLYADVRTGWDTNCCGMAKGGLWWDKAHTQKATAANAGAALAGAMLYRRTGDVSDLTFAQQVYSFWRTSMVNTTTWQVCDHITLNGEKVWWKFTYNEGLMIGACTELFDATGTATYLEDAHRFAGFMVGSEVLPTSYGNILNDGDNAGCLGDCAQFKSPAYRHLLRLYLMDTTKQQYYQVLKASVDALWIWPELQIIPRSRSVGMVLLNQLSSRGKRTLLSPR